MAAASPNEQRAGPLMRSPCCCMFKPAVVRGAGSMAATGDSAGVDDDGVDKLVGVTNEGGRGRATSRFEI